MLKYSVLYAVFQFYTYFPDDNNQLTTSCNIVTFPQILRFLQLLLTSQWKTNQSFKEKLQFLAPWSNENTCDSFQHSSETFRHLSLSEVFIAWSTRHKFHWPHSRPTGKLQASSLLSHGFITGREKVWSERSATWSGKEIRRRCFVTRHAGYRIRVDSSQGQTDVWLVSDCLLNDLCDDCGGGGGGRGRGSRSGRGRQGWGWGLEGRSVKQKRPEKHMRNRLFNLVQLSQSQYNRPHCTEFLLPDSLSIQQPPVLLNLLFQSGLDVQKHLVLLSLPLQVSPQLHQLIFQTAHLHSHTGKLSVLIL